MKKSMFKKLACMVVAICVVATMVSPAIFAQTMALTIESALVGGKELASAEGDAFVIASGSAISVSGEHESAEAEVTYLVTPVGTFEPIQGIGQVTADENGEFDVNVMLPVIMEPGTYALRVSGEDNPGPIERYFKIVVGLEKRIVLASEADSIKTVGGTLEITAEILNAVTGDEVVWKVESGEGVVSVNNGVVTALADGVAVITASLSTNPAVYAQKTIIVDTSVAEEVSLSVTATGGMGTVMSSGAYDGDASNLIGTFDFGSEFTLEAIADVDAEFVHWADARTGRVLSVKDTYSFAIGTNLAIEALFRNKTEPAYILFIEKNNKILKKANATDDVVVPNDPFYMGYDFANWIENGEVESELVAGDIIAANTYSQNVLFKANHNKGNTLYTVTAVNAVDDVSGDYLYDSKITVVAAEPEEGKKFAYWMRDGEIVSYSDTYTFYVGAGNTVVEACYTDEDAIVGEVPIITMFEPTVVSGNRIAFFAERKLPEAYTLIETGIILIENSNLASGEELTLANAHYTSKANSIMNVGQYTVRKANVAENEIWVGRAYMIYKDGNNIVTMYSKSVTKSLK